jgi:putative hydroxymethylpyrimidine transport system substrate-binding protein
MFFLLLATSAAKGTEKLVLMLDWFPNVDHVPIYAAIESGFFEKRGLFVEIQSPSDSADPLKLAAAGHADIALSYEPQILIAASEGIPLKAVGKLIGTPLTTLLFLETSGIRVPSDLEGKTIGYTVPGMMDHLAEAFASVNAIRDYKLLNVGFSILQSLTSGTADAVMGPFKTYEPVLLEMEGYDSRFFEIDHFGIPTYDELVFVTGDRTYKEKKESIVKFLAAIDEALVFTAAHPPEALALYFRAVPEAPAEMERTAFDRTLPFFAPDTTLSVDQWETFSEFALTCGMIEKKVDLYALLVSDR